MPSVKSEKAIEYFYIQQLLRNYLTSIIYVKEYFYMFFSTMKVLF